MTKILQPRHRPATTDIHTALDSKQKMPPTHGVKSRVIPFSPKAYNSKGFFLPVLAKFVRCVCPLPWENETVCRQFNEYGPHPK
jgi:hypothetical protein